MPATPVIYPSCPMFSLPGALPISLGLLACFVTTGSACFGGLPALAVDDCRGWCWFSPCPDAIDPNEMMIEAFEYPIVAQGAEPLVYRAPWRKTVGQKPPGT